MNWVVETILSAVISSIITVGFLSAIITKMQIGIELRTNGIRRIYPKGRSIKSMEKKMQNCTTIKVLAFSAFGFTHANRTALTNHVARGGRLELLLAKDNSAIARDASSMERRGNNAITNSITQTFALLQAIKQDAGIKANELRTRCGYIEVRQYNTEIRNQLVICTDDVRRETCAWMTILLPPLPAVECKMIEFSETNDCVAYYDTIWERSVATTRII